MPEHVSPTCKSTQPNQYCHPSFAFDIAIACCDSRRGAADSISIRRALLNEFFHSLARAAFRRIRRFPPPNERAGSNGRDGRQRRGHVASE
ncbi:hypothetical protein GBP346_B1048 [Burkholderia pseudomallei MSHR346]|nr:hypothetical protein GBP346_B1048 [Burkholderia pseudomallei MSHR346]